MDMHRAHRHADWEQTNPKEWNRWQRYAKQTSGWVTPGNVVSFIGLLTTMVGFNLAWHGAFAAGFWWIAVGRFADVLDGFAANKTGTKSSIGEAIDATSDKAVLLVAIIVLWHLQAVPHPLLLLVALVHACIGLVGIFARARNIEIHPSRTGKYGTVVLWCGLALALLQFAGVHSRVESGDMLTIALIMALYALYTYVRDIIARPFDKPAPGLKREFE